MIFAATVGILLYAYSRVVHVAWFDTFLDLHAVVTGGLIRVLGFDVETSGSIPTNDRVAFNIISECTAVAPSIIFGAGVVAFPATWRAKAAGLTAGIVALTVVNIVRITSLFFIGMYIPSTLDAFHLIVWQSLMIILAIAILFFWTARVQNRTVTPGSA